MKRVLLFITILFFVISQNIQAQTADTLSKKKERVRKGWSFGAVPAIAYDTDIGFKYGGVVNFYDYGDGTIYPEYKHSLFFEWSRTTKGSGINQFMYDSEYLIPGIRITAEASYLTERALDFYGFNGYESYYNAAFEDDSDTANYISRLYYRQERKMLRLRADFQGRFFNDKFRWLAGVTHYNIKTDTIDIKLLNRGTPEDEKLPPAGGGLYGQYVGWNVIPEDQIYGGSSTLIKIGLVYDTRDNEPNPMRGVWSEIILFVSPGFLGSNSYSFTKLSIVHRQYFTIFPDRLSFVYRIAYQDKLTGKMPYYMLPFIFNGGNSLDRDGLGGAKTLRGILRNRIVGEDYLFGNFEFRWKFFKAVVFNQNIYLALNFFSDMGMVTQKYKIDTSSVPPDQEYQDMFPDDKEKLHISYGTGFHVALNQNFIVAFNYGLAADKRDGKQGFYINLNWLF
ncbi:MAG: BamA/TamA family outer membrane protein [Bacteroidales bacterium]|nr:BamA/TamA family outer membrane protein [Bacteroidales bacterium]